MDSDSDDSDTSAYVQRRYSLVAAALTAIVPQVMATEDPIPRNNSEHTAKLRLAELMATEHAGRFRSEMKMNKPTFLALCAFLRTNRVMEDKRETTVEERVSIFIRHGLCSESNRTTQNNKQRSASTISLALNEVADAIVSQLDSFIRPPLPHDEPLDGIMDNPKFSPYFDEFDGAVDGTHVPAVVPSSQFRVMRNRKHEITQNVLVYMGFNLQCYYILAGWEGSAHDANVLEDAKSKGFPAGGKKFVDAAFTQTHEFVKPYRGVRYHLSEWGPAELRPQNKEELFNLRHAMKRNCVERGIGVVKKRFPVLCNMLHFSMELQVKLVLCAFALHNFIIRHATFEDDEFDNLTDEEMEAAALEALEDEEADYVADAEEAEYAQAPAQAVGGETPAQWRDRIAQQMWVDYQAELAARG